MFIKQKKILIILMGLLISLLYLKGTSGPVYNGRLTIDINNTTLKTINEATLEYESVGKIVKLPSIKPLERLIIVAPTNISDKPLKTRVFMNCNGTKEEILGEYHILDGSRYNVDTAQFVQTTVKQNAIKVKENSLFSLRKYINLKPYIRRIDMDDM